jgi:hypothetical protein
VHELLFFIVCKCSVPVEISPLQFQQKIVSVISIMLAAWLPGLLFNPEDGDNTFPRNVNEYLPGYTVSDAKRPYSS